MERRDGPRAGRGLYECEAALVLDAFSCIFDGPHFIGASNSAQITVHDYTAAIRFVNEGWSRLGIEWFCVVQLLMGYRSRRIGYVSFEASRQRLALLREARLKTMEFQ